MNWAEYFAVMASCFVLGDPFGLLDVIGWRVARWGLAKVPPLPPEPTKRPPPSSSGFMQISSGSQLQASPGFHARTADGGIVLRQGQDLFIYRPSPIEFPEGTS